MKIKNTRLFSELNFSDFLASFLDKVELRVSRLAKRAKGAKNVKVPL